MVDMGRGSYGAHVAATSVVMGLFCDVRAILLSFERLMKQGRNSTSYGLLLLLTEIEYWERSIKTFWGDRNILYVTEFVLCLYMCVYIYIYLSECGKCSPRNSAFLSYIKFTLRERKISSIKITESQIIICVLKFLGEQLALKCNF